MLRQSVISPLEGSRTGLASEKSECDANGRPAMIDDLVSSLKPLFKVCSARRGSSHFPLPPQDESQLMKVAEQPQPRVGSTQSAKSFPSLRGLLSVTFCLGQEMSTS